MSLQGVGVGVEASLLNKGDEVLVPTSSHGSDPEAVGSELCDKCKRKSEPRNNISKRPERRQACQRNENHSLSFVRLGSRNRDWPQECDSRLPEAKPDLHPERNNILW